MKTEKAQKLNRRGLWLTAAVMIMGGVFGAALLLDLANQGVAWRLFYGWTGEETPAAQLRGMVELAGNAIRPSPDTQPYTPIQHAGVNPFGINTFLEQEVEPEKRERIMQMLADAGFAWIRQEFPWEDIEIHGRGDFIDRRNDVDGDGEIDEIDAWAKYDQIVDLADAYDIEIQARLTNPPAWTHADPDTGQFAPPDNIQDYVNFITTLAERYDGRIRYYQVWNEPNIYPEWGNNDVNPEAYTELLCRAYDALKAVDPEIVVVSGALAPTNALTGRDLNELIYLQRMYNAGAADCFDVLAMNGYGINSGPTDHRLRPTTVNYGRHTYVRDLMVNNGDAHKPIWISEAAWNPVPSADEVPEIEGRFNFGQVTEEQAARYMPQAYQRAQEDWPWVGPVFYWFFKRPADYERNQSFYYFRMVEPDFTPLPIYDAMTDYIANHDGTLYRGVHQADHWLIAAENVEPVAVDGAQFDEALRVDSASMLVHGTHALVRWQGDDLRVVMDCSDVLLELEGDGDEWQTAVIDLRLLVLSETRALCLESEGGFLLDSVTVYDRMWLTLFSPLVYAGLPVVGGVLAVVLGLWRRLRG